MKTKSHSREFQPDSASNQGFAFSKASGKNGEPPRNEAGDCKTGTDSACEPHRSLHIPGQRLYIIEREGGGIKIGISLRPRNRRSNLQMATPEKLTLEKTFRPKNKTAAAIEAEFKALLRPLRIRGEWFKTTPDFAEIAVEALLEECPVKLAFVGHFIEYELAPDEQSYPLSQSLKAAYPELYGRCCFEL